MGSIKEALAACNQVLEMDADNLDALIDRAEAHITNEEYDKGEWLWNGGGNGRCAFSPFTQALSIHGRM